MSPSDTPSQRIMLLAGGTGGHVFPALALSHELTQQGVSVSFLTDRRGVRYLNDLPSTVPLKVMPLGSLPTGWGGKVLLLGQLFASFACSLLFILQQRPHKIIGYGGYPTAPGMVASLLLGRKLYVSEQDAVLGSTNKRFARFCHRIFLATPLLNPLKSSMAEKCQVVGMPIRAPIAALNNRLYQPPQQKGPIHLTVIGGSQGAEILSEIVPPALSKLPVSLKKRLQVIQQCREEDSDRVKAFYRQAGIHATVSPFFNQMEQILAQTHLMICRSGASTVAEGVAAGLPALFIPYPYAAHDHQTANASLLVNQGAGWMMAQKDFTVERCGLFLRQVLMDPQRLLFASERLKLFSQKNVTQTLASHLLNV